MENQKLSSRSDIPKESAITVTDCHGHVHHFHGHFKHWIEGNWVRFRKLIYFQSTPESAPAIVESGSIEFFSPAQVIIQ